MSNQFEYPGLADKIASALSFQRHAKVPPSRVALNVHELQYIHSCMSFYVSEQMLRRVEKLPLAVTPNVHGWTIMDPPGQKWCDAETAMRHNDPDTLPCETE